MLLLQLTLTSLFTSLFILLQDVLRDVWVSKGVKAFLMANADTQELRDARDAINAALKDEVDGYVCREYSCVDVLRVTIRILKHREN